MDAAAIGVSAVGFGDPDFNGQIDEFRIWNRALASGEIAANFAAGPNFIPGLVIPEPATVIIWSLLAGLGIAAGWRRRTKR